MRPSRGREGKRKGDCCHLLHQPSVCGHTLSLALASGVHFVTWTKQTKHSGICSPSLHTHTLTQFPKGKGRFSPSWLLPCYVNRFSSYAITNLSVGDVMSVFWGFLVPGGFLLPKPGREKVRTRIYALSKLRTRQTKVTKWIQCLSDAPAFYAEISPTWSNLWNAAKPKICLLVT